MRPRGRCSIVSWNLLAPMFTKQQPRHYRHVSRAHLSWDWRQDQIVSTLEAIDADIVCLQEVEAERWENLLARLEALGYDGVLQKSRKRLHGGHPIRVAVLHRRSILELARHESRSRALISVLRPRAATGRAATPLYLANVHLDANPDASDARLFQLRSLLRRLELQREVDVSAMAVELKSKT